MASKRVATVVMAVEEITTTDVTWFVSAEDLKTLGVEDVNDLQEKIRNREVDMFTLDPVDWEAVDSEVRQAFPDTADVTQD